MMGKRQIKAWVDADLPYLSEEKGFQHLECVQQAGDVMIVPELWGHGVVNLQDTLAVATELKGGMYRVYPMLTSSMRLPQMFERRVSDS